MKKLTVFVLALIMALAAIPAASASAEELPEITYSEHLTDGNDEGTAYDVTNASIAWVKQASGALVWVPAGDSRSNEDIVAQAKEADASLNGGTSSFAVLKGFGTAQTPNSNGSKATVTVKEVNGTILFTIDGKYSHYVAGTSATASGSVGTEGEPEDVTPEEPAVEEPADAEPAYEPDPADLIDTEESTDATVGIRIDAPQKMAVAFADGTVYYGGEMKDVVIGQEYAFQMCSVNWDNGVYDEENGLLGTVVYRMVVVHRSDFLAVAREAKADTTGRYVVKGIDVIDTQEKTITVNGDAEDAHLETDVNSFFVAYRFHFNGNDYNKKTGIDGVVNTPLESLSVNLPLGSTVTCKAFVGDSQVDTDNVFVTVNNGQGEYDDVFLTSVNDYTWNTDLPDEVE